MRRDRINYLLLIGAVLLFAGCQKSGQSGSAALTAGLDGPGQMMDYLRNEPAVRSVEPWQYNGASGMVIHTAHYTLRTTLMEPLMLRQLPAYLESAWKAYQSQLPQPLAASRELEIYLFDTRLQWEQFTRQFTGPDAEVYLKIQRGAYTVNGIVVAYNIGRKQTASVIGHEGWHQFNQRLFVYRLPSWLDEGVATLFETCRYTQGQFVFEPQRNLMRLGALKETIQQDKLIPLASLIVLNPGQVLDGYGDDNDAIVAFYAQNYALVRFLREYNYGIRLRKYHALLLGGADGSWPLSPDAAALAADRTRPLTVSWNRQVSPALFAWYIDPQIQNLQAEYEAFCKKSVYHVRLK